MAKTHLVTGVNGLLGRAVELGLKAEGVDVFTHTRSGQGSDFGGDLCEKATAASIIGTIGMLDVLICCHGGHRGGEDNVELMLRDNLISTINICEAAIHQMCKNARGKIVLVGSYAGCFGKPTGIGYAVSKAAVHHYSRCLASRYREFGIAVNCIAPGNISPTNGPNRVQVDTVAKAIIYLSKMDNVSAQVIRVDGGKHTFAC